MGVSHSAGSFDQTWLTFIPSTCVTSPLICFKTRISLYLRICLFNRQIIELALSNGPLDTINSMKITLNNHFDIYNWLISNRETYRNFGEDIEKKG